MQTKVLTDEDIRTIQAALDEAEDESQQRPELHAAIREARKAFQASGEMPNWEWFVPLVDVARNAPE